jgi:F-type H+-transporting ATPase subunit b
MHADWWTLALQTVNVLILVWILARFFFRPITDIVAKRQEETKKLFDAAAAARKQAADAYGQAEKARAEIAAGRDRLLAEAQKAAQAEKNKLEQEVARDAAKLRRESETAIARDRAAAEKQIMEHASALSVDIARRLLERMPPNFALEAFLTVLCDEIGKLSVDVRTAFLAATTDRPIEVLTRGPLSERETNRVRDTLMQAFGTELPFTFRGDANVLAGIELHGHNVFLRNSWRADLERIRQELNRERNAKQS